MVSQVFSVKKSHSKPPPIEVWSCWSPLHSFSHHTLKPPIKYKVRPVPQPVGRDVLAPFTSISSICWKSVTSSHHPSPSLTTTSAQIETSPKPLDTSTHVHAAPHTAAIHATPHARVAAPTSSSAGFLRVLRTKTADASKEVEDVCQADNTTEVTTQTGAWKRG